MTHSEKRDIIDKIELAESLLKAIRDKINKEIVEYEVPKKITGGTGKNQFDGTSQTTVT